MGVCKRAWLYLVRKKLRSGILFFLLFAAGLFLLVGGSVRMGADLACEDIKKSLTSSIDITVKPVDRNEFYDITENENGQEVSIAKKEIFTWEKLEKILDIPGVDGYYIQGSGDTLYTGLESVPGNWAASLQEGYYGEPKSREEEETIQNLQASGRLQTKSLTFHPVYEGKWEPSFLNGALTITEGRNVERTDKKKAVISERIAKKNGLCVGDTISARNYDFVTAELYGSAMEFEIVGIYRMNFKQVYSPETTNEDMIMENMVFCDREIAAWSSMEYHKQHGLLQGILLGKAAEHVGNAKIYVNDPDLLSGVKEQILAVDSVDWSLYDIEYDDTDYRSAAGPLLFVRKLFTAFLVILFAGTLLILCLVLSMWIRGRSYEIGILVSVGTKKRTIFMQIALECGMIAASAFLLAGSVFVPVTEKTKDAVETWFSSSEKEEDYTAVFDMSTNTFEIHKDVPGPIALQHASVWENAVISLSVMFLAVIGAALYVSAKIIVQKPTEILRNR